ncbi:hypothetical protein ACNPQM_08135 [Streptomyces sp. NPDC056231]
MSEPPVEPPVDGSVPDTGAALPVPIDSPAASTGVVGTDPQILPPSAEG